MTKTSTWGRVRAFMRSSTFLGNAGQQRSLEYDAAGNGRRSTGWGTSNGGPNSVLVGNIDTLRRRSRHEARTNAWAASISEVIVTNVIGSGIKPMTKFPDLQRLWNKWTDEADASFSTDFYGLQAIALRSVIEGGDCFVRTRPRRPEDGLSVPLQLQVLEAEHVPTTMSKDLGAAGSIVGGVEFDGIGRPAAYHMFREHPGERLLLNADNMATVRVPADSVMHLRMVRRPGEVRGEPWLARALVRLRELDLYNDAELVRKKSAAMFGGFIHTPGTDDDADILAGVGASQEDGVVIDPLEPGTFPVLPPGYEVTFSQPADVGGSFDTFMRAQLRAIASSVGVTYEQLTGDYSQVNDRTMRAALLEFKRRASMWQWHLVVWQLCRPVWRRFVDMAILSGAWTPPAGASDDEIYAVEWTPEGWSYLNPIQEIRAYQEAIRSGLTSRSRVISELGYDASQIDREIAADNARADELGLMFDSDARTDKRDTVPGDPENTENIT